MPTLLQVSDRSRWIAQHRLPIRVILGLLLAGSLAWGVGGFANGHSAQGVVGLAVALSLASSIYNTFVTVRNVKQTDAP